jgi:hypothetical protein
VTRRRVLVGLAVLFWACRQHVTVAAGSSAISVPVVALVAVVAALCAALALAIVLWALTRDSLRSSPALRTTR